MAEMTAVEWVIEQLQAPCKGIPSHIIEQSKQIEKQQMKDAWEDIEEEYLKENYPVFGGPFTDALTPFEWLKRYFKSPERK